MTSPRARRWPRSKAPEPAAHAALAPAELVPQSQSLQLLAGLEAEQRAVDTFARAQHDAAQHLDQLGFGGRIGLEGDVLGEPLNRLLVKPVLRVVHRQTPSCV